MAGVALVTCSILPEPDPDQELLLGALRERGVRAELLAWDDPNADPGEFDLCVLRSCWDYFERPEEFLAWIETAAAESRLYNPAQVVRWNSHKSYLRVLEATNVPIIPTAWPATGKIPDLTAIMHDHDWDDVVVKPAVSAGSYRTQRFRKSEIAEGQAFLESLVQHRDAMVQRYIPAVENPGERAIVWIDGEVTHAVVKKPRLMGADEQVSSAQAISDQDRSIANQALACVNEELLYARIDVVADSDGTPVVSEFELIEPSLFFLQFPAALERFVDAIERRISKQEM